ncbi:MAG: hypothetical protein WAT93_07055 [Pontixanthobacter sp.]
MLSSLLALLMQVGPNPGAMPITAVPPELDELRRRQRSEQSDIPLQSGKLESCIARAERDSTAARTEAEAWLAGAVGITKSQALQCRGYAEANLYRWADAASSFLAARDEDASKSDPKYRARLSAMAANALISAGNMRRALELLDMADSDAQAAGFDALRGEIAIDRARVHVALGESEQADAALASARNVLPNSAQAWLLSATLARRMDDLPRAQSFIERASSLDLVNPEIGLEAGVIAVLAGKDDAARKSWQSIINLAPDSPQAQTAREYLRQLEPS